MFNPRTDLPDPGVLAMLGTAFYTVALLGDVAITRYGIWYRGLVEKNPLIKNKYYDLTKTSGGTFIDGAARIGLVTATVAASDHFGVDKAWFFLMCSVAPIAMIVRNYLLLKKK
jgi:hypothetical protein